VRLQPNSSLRPTPKWYKYLPYGIGSRVKENPMSCLRLAALAIAAALTVGHPSWAQSTAPAAESAPTQQSNDPFGEEITLVAKTIIFMKGTGAWESAFETLIDAFKSVYAFLDRQGIKPAGPVMTIYTATDDVGFQYQAAVPISETPRNPPRGDIAVGQSPAGKALKFVHRGSYDAMDNTYEAITNYLDEKKLEAKDMFIEEYQTDPVTTPEDKLVVNVFVPLK
jgi:effector-binding domain-containing protein